MGKGDQKHKRRRKQAKQQMQAVVAGNAAQPTSQATYDKAERPTAERMARGFWNEPQGMGKHERPFVDLHADMVGLLFADNMITTSQEQAARHWQQLRARYIEELPDVSGYKSCIAGGVGAYDASDGNPEIIAEYRQLERRLSRVQRAELLRVCEEGNKPRGLDLLQGALDVIAGLDTGRKIGQVCA